MLSLLRIFIILGLVAQVLSAASDIGQRSTSADRSRQQSSLLHLAKRGDRDALLAFSSAALASQQAYWIDICAQLNSASCQFWMANHGANRSQRLALLGEAAAAGHLASQFAYSQALSDPLQQQKWLQRAAHGGYPQAIITLAEQLTQAQSDDAFNWQVQAATYKPALAIQFADNLWQKQQIEQSRRFLQLLNTATFPQAQARLSAIARFTDPQPIKISKQTAGRCAMQVQMVADSMQSMLKINSILQRWASDERLQGLPICVNSPVWLDPGKLNCSQDVRTRLRCNLASLVQLHDNSAFTHLIVVSAKGKANVNNGIMYLDLSDDYNVFVHELAHFAGFVDEYPLPNGLSSMHCRASDAPNLWISSGPISISKSPWQGYVNQGYELSLSPVRTCQNIALDAYKPVKQTTFMEYHDVALIPPLYMALWHKQLQSRANLTPVYVNFADYFDDLSQRKSANVWKQKLQEYYQL